VMEEDGPAGGATTTLPVWLMKKQAFLSHEGGSKEIKWWVSSIVIECFDRC